MIVSQPGPNSNSGAIIKWKNMNSTSNLPHSNQLSFFHDAAIVQCQIKLCSPRAGYTRKTTRSEWLEYK